jgi:hypothetical protein
MLWFLIPHKFRYGAEDVLKSDESRAMVDRYTHFLKENHGSSEARTGVRGYHPTLLFSAATIRLIKNQVIYRWVWTTCGLAPRQGVALHGECVIL